MTRQVAVFFFAALGLLCETLLFHATKYVVDYMAAMVVISCAVAGVGLGAFLASCWSASQRDTFGLCCGGTTVCLYLAAWTLLRCPTLVLLAPAMASVFICPSYYIARSFSQGPPRTVYLFDMLGAGAAVAVTVLAYQWLSSEEIFLIVVTVIPLAGAVAAVCTAYRLRWRVALCGALLAGSAVGGTLLLEQVRSNTLNIAKLVNPDASAIPLQSILRRRSRLVIERTYDSLIGRIDVVPATDRIFVTYDGFFNDNFKSVRAFDYAQYAGRYDVRWPNLDRRVVYGLVPTPSAFVIGPATTGILKTLREITPLDKIDAVEINPGVLRMMQQDYVEASGGAYCDLHAELGNALSVLRRSDKKYDVITLINAHSSRWIGSLGPPDYLHTRESYDLYFDHLTDDGYLLFEERPDTYRGELGVKRMIMTLWDCLARRGVRNPAEHFFVWEFMSQRYTNQGLTGIAPGSDMYYVGMVVSLKPFVGQRRADLLEWSELEYVIRWDDTGPVYRPYTRLQEPAYLQGQWHGERFGPFFDLLAAGNAAAFDPDFDASIMTNDRPFASYASMSIPEMTQLLAVVCGVCIALGALFTAGALRGAGRRGGVCLLLVYNIAIGCGYFLVEIMLIQAYQEVFLSPTTSLVLVLAVLLVGSAIGGLLSHRVRLSWVTAALAPMLAVSPCIPAWTLSLEPRVACGAAVAVVFLVGMHLGVYFPSGLLLAERWSLRDKVPHLFAVNAVAGSLATVVSLGLAIRVGYTWTLGCAFGLYVVAAVAHHVAARLAARSVAAV